MTMLSNAPAPSRSLRVRRAAALFAGVLATALVAGACGDFNITNPNQPTVDDLLNHPTRGKLAAAATGIFSASRTDIQGLIWRMGSMGREGINLAGNNQPDYQEPYFGPLSPSGFGGALWFNEYSQIRNTNTYLTAAPKATDIGADELAASQGFARTMKALAFLYIVQTRGALGAPVDVDHDVTAAPAPFVSEDSVYGYAISLLDSGLTNLQAGSGTFPFSIPTGFQAFSTPATFAQFNRALAAKAWVLRATAGCGQPCFANALTILTSGTTFLSEDPAAFGDGAYFDFSNAAGDAPNLLSETLDGTTFFADPFYFTAAQHQANDSLDERLRTKVAKATRVPPQSVGGVDITGVYKFVNYFLNGQADQTAPIPIIRDEELILLRAESKLGTGDAPGATTDLNLVHTNSGKLPALAGGLSADSLLNDLLYERRFSLMWEQGTRWNDARRYGKLATIEPGVTGGVVPTIMPIPETECSARGLGSGCTPLSPAAALSRAFVKRR